MYKEYFDEKGNKQKYLVEYINRGHFGNVYKLNDNTCLKEFIDPKISVDLNIIKIIKDLKLEAFYRVYQILFNHNQEFVGYTMEYYPEENIDILTMPTEYTIESMNKIIQSIKILTDLQILISDLREKNVIKNSNGITIIDTDNYAFFPELSKKELLIENHEAVNRLYKELYIISLLSHREYLQSGKYPIFELFYHSNSFKEISKTLSKHKYPIDYITSKAK